MTRRSAIEELFAMHCKAYGLKPEPEYRFHPTRKWRFDFAFPDRMVAVEIEGGVWTGGRHTRGSGFVADIEKYNAAAALGWFVFRFHGDAVKKGEAIRFMVSVLGAEKSSVKLSETRAGEEK
jgi:very-short-patch-repair endonuclease